MARALLVGCGCRGRRLGSLLRDRGWQVRGTSRTDRGLELIAREGIEPALADPDRPGTVLDHVGDVTAVAWLLAGAEGEPDSLAALHGARLERLLEKLVDTPVRGFVYEARGTLPEQVLERGRGLVEDASRRWRIPVALIEVDHEPPSKWAAAAATAVEAAIAG